MARNRRMVVSTISVTLAAALLTGCSHGAATESRDKGPNAHPSAEPTLSPEALRTINKDTRACAGAEAVIGHITVSAARWSPQLDPFNKGISRSIGILADDLDKQGPLGDSERIQTSVHAMAQAFTAVSGAMAGKNQAKVATAINASRESYRDLKKVCAFD